MRNKEHEQKRKQQMENVNLTRTNKYIGTNVVDIDDESSFPIHLLNEVKSSNA